LTYGFAIFHRYCRILPSYLIAMLIYWKIVTLTGSGPLWQDLIDRSADCQYLWRNMLFVDNLFSLWDDPHYCFGWGWYLSNDFQLFIFSLIIIFFYAFKPLIGKILIILSIMGTSAAGLIVAYNGHFKLFPYVISGYGVYDFMNNYYYKPYCRAPPYLFGLFFGILYKEYANAQKELEEKKISRNTTFLAGLRRKFEESDIIRMAFYVFGLFIILFLSFFQRQVQIDENNLSDTFQLIFLSFQRLLYVFGLTLLLMNNFIYKKDIIGRILSWKPLGVITKLNFCAYLVHYFIIERSMLNVKQAVYYNAENIFYFFFSDFIFTVILASLLSLCVEIPFVNLEKFLKGGKRERNTTKKEQSMRNISKNDETTDELKKTEVKERQ
jgi:peptidoglycan/LPS O-acetylase OafA/YrhL